MTKPKIFMVETRKDDWYSPSDIFYRFFLSLEDANKFIKIHQSKSYGPYPEHEIFEFLEGEQYEKSDYGDKHIRFKKAYTYDDCFNCSEWDCTGDCCETPNKETTN